MAGFLDLLESIAPYLRLALPLAGGGLSLFDRPQKPEFIPQPQPTLADTRTPEQMKGLQSLQSQLAEYDAPFESFAAGPQGQLLQMAGQGAAAKRGLTPGGGLANALPAEAVLRARLEGRSGVARALAGSPGFSALPGVPIQRPSLSTSLAPAGQALGAALGEMAGMPERRRQSALTEELMRRSGGYGTMPQASSSQDLYT